MLNYIWSLNIWERLDSFSFLIFCKTGIYVTQFRPRHFFGHFCIFSSQIDSPFVLSSRASNVFYFSFFLLDLIVFFISSNPSAFEPSWLMKHHQSFFHHNDCFLVEPLARRDREHKGRDLVDLLSVRGWYSVARNSIHGLCYMYSIFCKMLRSIWNIWCNLKIRSKSLHHNPPLIYKWFWLPY